MTGHEVGNARQQRSLPDIEDLTARDLLRLYGRVMARLRVVLIKTGNSPVGEYGEILAGLALGGSPEGFSTKGFDVLSPDSGRLQVKTATVDPGKQPRFSVIRGLRDSELHFDHALFLVLDRLDFDVVGAWLVSREVLPTLARYSSHVNGSQVTASALRAAVMSGLDGVRDVREELASAQRAHDAAALPHTGPAAETAD